MIRTHAAFARSGVPTMIRAQVANESEPYFTFLQAAFLLGAEQYSYVAMGVGWAGAETSFPWFSAYSAPLGPPLAPMTTLNPTLGVFSRRFEHVDVFVNVSSWSATIVPRNRSLGTTRLGGKPGLPAKQA